MSRRRIPSFITHWTTDLKRPLYGIKNRLQDYVLGAREHLTGAIRHLYGPTTVETGPNEMVVLCLVRDGETWVDEFVDHHLTLGARHIFMLDNGSSDSTVERATRSDRVSVWQTTLPFRTYSDSFRRWLTANFGRGRWALHADVDELFDYPRSRDLSLRGFLEYLNHRNYRAVLAHMVDMFSDRPLQDLHDPLGEPVSPRYRYYDLSGIERRRDIYWIRDQALTDSGLFCAFGGLRKTVFGTEGILQSKHPLVFFGDGVRVYPYDGHFATGAPVADVTAALLHYKFVAGVQERAVEGARLYTSRYTRNYRDFARRFAERPDLTLHSESARELESVDDLVDEGFLTVSREYEEWVESWKG